METKELLDALEHCEKMIAPLRKRAVLAEAVCEAVLKCRLLDDIYMHASVKHALDEWELKRPIG